jgi:hypothetical protein
VHDAFPGRAMHAATSPGDALQFRVAWRSLSQSGGVTSAALPLDPQVTVTDVAPLMQIRYERKGLRQLDGTRLRSLHALRHVL